jgi:hypothetical protein
MSKITCSYIWMCLENFTRCRRNMKNVLLLLGKHVDITEGRLHVMG